MTQKKLSQISTPHTPELVEVVDKNDKSLMVMPLDEVHRQSLMHRSVLILVYDMKNKLYLQKRGKNKSLYPGRLDISASGHVQQGESREDAAVRELYEELGLRTDRLTRIHEIPASNDTHFEFLTLFTAGKFAHPPTPNPDELDGGHFVDPDELGFLVNEYRETLTPGLVYCYEKKLLQFPNS